MNRARRYAPPMKIAGRCNNRHFQAIRPQIPNFTVHIKQIQ
jgi:hypothetical protein